MKISQRGGKNMRQKTRYITIFLVSAMLGLLSGGLADRFIAPETVPAYADSDATAIGIPFLKEKTSTEPTITEVVPLGMTIGVRINTNGVMVLGTGPFLGNDGQPHSPSDGILRGGDLILTVNGKPIDSKEALSQLIAESTGDVTLEIRRDGDEFEVNLTPMLAATDDVRRIGIWVRDSTKGIGTLTYYVPATGHFGAIGHGILDVDTKKLITVRSGVIMPSNVTSIVRGTRGNPGELEGSVDATTILGNVELNSISGIYGSLSPEFMASLPTGAMPIATRDQIKEGPATILTNVVGNEVKSFDITIEGVNQSATDETKGMIIRITDPELLAATGGIVQGMSGSPIIQDGLVVGAVTHVFVQDPTKGYGIFVETMLGAREGVLAVV